MSAGRQDELINLQYLCGNNSYMVRRNIEKWIVTSSAERKQGEWEALLWERRIFIVKYGLIMKFKRQNHVDAVLMDSLCGASSSILELISLVVSQPRDNHQTNTLVSV